MKKATLFAIIACFTFSMSPLIELHAKRSAAKAVESVVHNEITYKAPMTREMIGKIQAYKDNKLLWTKTIYNITYNENLETDVQDVYITSLSIDKTTLTIKAENGKCYSFDVKTYKVKEIESDK